MPLSDSTVTDVAVSAHYELTQAQPAIGFQEGLISEQGWMEAHASAPSVTENASAGIDTDVNCYSRESVVSSSTFPCHIDLSRIIQQ